MALNDPIADLLTRIRNACHARHRYCDVRWSKEKESIVSILKQLGFVEGFLVREEGPFKRMRIFLKYAEGRRSVIEGLQRMSTPGCRKYVATDRIPSILGGIGVTIISTNQGIMSGPEARKRGIGGELLCKVW